MKKIITKAIDTRLEILQSNIELANFPKGFRQGLYEEALSILKDWQKEKIKTEQLIKDRNNIVWFADKNILDDLKLINLEKKIADNKKND